MKEKYTSPDIQVIEVSLEQVIAASSYTYSDTRCKCHSCHNSSCPHSR